MTIGERIKKIRKAFDLTQQEFADRIGSKRNTVATYEMGRTEPSAAVITLICREFNVNEKWLRTEDGEMFNPTPETTIDEIVRDYGLDDLDRQIITEYLKLSDQDREAVKRYIQRVAERIQAQAQNKTLEQQADEFAAMAREQFLSEQEQAAQALSARESAAG